MRRPGTRRKCRAAQDSTLLGDLETLMVAPRFVKQALLDEPITVYGSGTQRCSFTWVGDVVNAMMKLIQQPEAISEVFNIGHTDEMSIYELAELEKTMTDSTLESLFIPHEPAYESGFEGMARRLPDLTKIQWAIGDRPTLDLLRMLEWLIAYSRMQLISRRRRNPRLGHC